MSEVFKSMMAKYKATHKPKVAIKTYDLKNYFSTYIPDGVQTAKKRIRIIPITGSDVFWVEKWAHKLKVGDKYPVFACLDKEEGKPCPFCEARQALLNNPDKTESDIKLAKTYSNRLFYIVKVIDRDNEQDGPKFWRISHDYRKTGILDTLMSVMEDSGHDMTDPNTGRDFKITIARNSNNVPVVQAITPDLKVTKLSDDEDKSNEWLNDERTWRDVYSLRDYNYLSIIVSGETPVYDKDEGKFVSLEERNAKREVDDKEFNKQLNDVDSELTIDESNEDKSNSENYQEEDGDDLPF